MAAYAYAQVSTAQQEGEHQRSCILTSAQARTPGPLQEVREIAVGLHEVTAR
jgi:hypothetical protein